MPSSNYKVFSTEHIDASLVIDSNDIKNIERVSAKPALSSWIRHTELATTRRSKPYSNGIIKAGHLKIKTSESTNRNQNLGTLYAPIDSGAGAESYKI